MSAPPPQRPHNATDFLQNHLHQPSTCPLDNDCPICRLPYSDGTEADSTSNPRTITCNHTFCYTCISQWVRLNPENSNTCPTCRTVLFRSQPEPLGGDNERETRYGERRRRIRLLLEDLVAVDRIVAREGASRGEEWMEGMRRVREGIERERMGLYWEEVGDEEEGVGVGLWGEYVGGMRD